MSALEEKHTFFSHVFLITSAKGIGTQCFQITASGPDYFLSFREILKKLRRKISNFFSNMPTLHIFMLRK